MPAGADQGAGDRRGRGPAATRPWPTCSRGLDLTPGQGIDFAALGASCFSSSGSSSLRRCCMWVAGLHPRRRASQRTIYDLRASRRGQDQPAAAALLRQAAPRRAAQPGHQRHRQHPQLPAADPAPAAQRRCSPWSPSSAMMFWISWMLALIALVTIPISIVVTRRSPSASQKLFAAAVEAAPAPSTGIIEETFTGHGARQGLRPPEGGRRPASTHKNEELYGAAFGAQFISGIIMPTMMFIGNLNYVAIAVVGGLRVASGSMSLGDVQAFIQYSRQFTQPLTQVASMANLLQSGVASAERVFEVLDAPEQRPDPAAAGRLAEPHGARGLRARRLLLRRRPAAHRGPRPRRRARTDRRDRRARPARARRPSSTSSCASTSSTRGRITLDGVDITAMTRHDLRSRIGMVLQDTWLFGGTIRDNIAYGRPDGDAGGGARRPRRRPTSTASSTRLPDGYDTVLDDEAGNISAGEKQLVTIARAFLAQPDLLILDEATSSVDTRTELLVQQAMAALRSDRTSFVIAHRLSTIRDADLILVMEEGRIVEQGTHAELLERERRLRPPVRRAVRRRRRRPRRGVRAAGDRRGGRARRRPSGARPGRRGSARPGRRAGCPGPRRADDAPG